MYGFLLNRGVTADVVKHMEDEKVTEMFVMACTH